MQILHIPVLYHTNIMRYEWIHGELVLVITITPSLALQHTHDLVHQVPLFSRFMSP